jgi:hypothetical protein
LYAEKLTIGTINWDNFVKRQSELLCGLRHDQHGRTLRLAARSEPWDTASRVKALRRLAFLQAILLNVILHFTCTTSNEDGMQIILQDGYFNGERLEVEDWAYRGSQGREWRAVPLGGRKPGTRVKVTEEVERVIRERAGAGDSIASIARVCGPSRVTVYATFEARTLTPQKPNSHSAAPAAATAATMRKKN